MFAGNFLLPQLKQGQMIPLPTMLIHALPRVSTRGFFKAPLGVWGVCRKLFIAPAKAGDK
ncbi:hypothetical protein BZG02_02660 [Labilibaculum filiforme]|uniref:Uncharacterized protein n=1 Tax=Labilibaculum filiforme TaxID=1940526 RepID=A0A2N3I6P9_9BACT|nr:hypothetical protein BZG02_02660 [Labilibaculum filiforme]